jgi:hypothetical protein
MTDDERKDWLRALRTVNDDYVLELLDEAMRRARAAAWEECFESGTPWINPYAEEPNDD